MTTAFKQVADGAKTTCATPGDLNNITNPLTWTCVTGQGARFPTPGNGFWLTIWDSGTYPDPADDPSMEKCLVTALTGDSFTMNRGQLGTSAAAHSGTPAVRLLVVAQETTDEQTAINALETLLLPGIVWPYAGSAAPTGWCLCNGQALSRTGAAALFAVIGTTYGAGDGSTTFNVPDLRGRTIHGCTDGSLVGTNSQPILAYASTGGEQNHTLTTAELASHLHTQPAHSHHSPGTSFLVVGSGLSWPFAAGTSAGEATNTQNAGGDNTGNTGSGTAHNTMSPYMALTYIIKL